MSFFTVNHLSAGYDKNRVLSDVSFSLESGSVMGILGANGSGKTTLLKAVCGIVPHEGSCILDGTKLEGLSARSIAKLCSYIPQRSGITIDIPVLDVVLMGFNPRLGILEHPDAQMIAAARSALKQVGLAGREDDNYLHLSEGQKQLCILARTLVAQSSLLLLDEPESALDFRYRYQMLELLREWVHGKKVSVLAALHDPSLALNYCDRLMLLSDGVCLGCISPREDSMERMEALLSRLYGPVSLQTVVNRSGRRQLVMLKEDL